MGIISMISKRQLQKLKPPLPQALFVAKLKSATGLQTRKEPKAFTGHRSEIKKSRQPEKILTGLMNLSLSQKKFFRFGEKPERDPPQHMTHGSNVRIKPANLTARRLLAMFPANLAPVISELKKTSLIQNRLWRPERRQKLVLTR